MQEILNPWLRRPRQALCAWLLIPLASVLPAPAKVPAADDWALLQTESFTLFSNLDEAGVRAVGVNLEQLRAVLEQQFPDAAIEAPVPTLLYVFRDRRSFDPFALPGGGSGFYAPHIHANFAGLVASDSAEAIPIVYRQYASELIHSEVPQSPLWLRYGLAELLSTFAVEGKVARIGAPPDADAALRESAPMSLAEALSLDRYPAAAERAGAFVQRAWGVVHYLLMEDSERRRKTRAWVRRFAADESQRGAFLEALGTDVATLEREIDAYLGRDPLPERRVELERDAATGAEYARLSPPEALLSLADLLLHTQPAKRTEAREILDAVLELAPENGLATAGLGLLEEQAGNLQAARDLYARALETFTQQQIAGHRDGFRLYFYYGDAELKLLGQQRPQTDDQRAGLARAVEAFERCVELRPEYGEAWARLGYARSLEERPAAESVSALEKAYGLLPEREDLAMNLLLAYARTGQREPAARLVENLAHRGEGDETLGRAREILFQIDFNAAAGLVRQGKLDQAAEILQRIRDSSASPALRQQAGELLARING